MPCLLHAPVAKFAKNTFLSFTSNWIKPSNFTTSLWTFQTDHTPCNLKTCWCCLVSHKTQCPFCVNNRHCNSQNVGPNILVAATESIQNWLRCSSNVFWLFQRSPCFSSLLHAHFQLIWLRPSGVREFFCFPVSAQLAPPTQAPSQMLHTFLAPEPWLVLSMCPSDHNSWNDECSTEEFKKKKISSTSSKKSPNSSLLFSTGKSLRKWNGQPASADPAMPLLYDWLFQEQ